MNILKQVAGIDVAQKELVVSLGRLYEDLSPDIHAVKTFPNNMKGFTALALWVKKLCAATIPVRFVMEATGVYHEPLAYYLHDNGLEASIVLPNKISNYSRTLDTKTITDKTASQAITLFGLERKLDRWQKPKRTFRTLKQLTRERDQLVAERTVLKNQLHAERAAAFPHEKSLIRMQDRIILINKQAKEIQSEIAAIVKQDQEVAGQVKTMTSIPGVGTLTAVIVLAETNGFELIRNKKQLTSFAGLDVKEKQSGTSVKGKPKISKRGNRYLRKAMHMPALTAIKHEERFNAIFTRLVAKHGIKMKAIVAVQRKLLEMTYILCKTNKSYDKDFLKQQNEVPANGAVV
jgi:transposase